VADNPPTNAKGIALFTQGLVAKGHTGLKKIFLAAW
jgi:hypothetical protein